MHAIADCPVLSDYQRLVRGELPPAEVERLSGHLEGCDRCAAAVHTLLDGDTALDAVRQARSDTPTPRGELPSGLFQRLCALKPPASQTGTITEAVTSPGEPASQVAHSFLAPARKPDEIGRLGPYRVLRMLGTGGMGVVFLAEDVRLHRTVALKTMKPETAADPRHRQRFLREARAAAKVEDDHIVPIYDIGEERGVPWLAMPFLKGQSLDEMLKRMKVLKPAQAVRLGAQVAKGLAAAHAAGLIHRDIKPANIWIEPEGGGRAKLLDFGLARDTRPNPEGTEPLTRTGAVVGTPAFMAPEQARGEPLDARADLFGLGCVLYRAVTGRLPFQGEGAMGKLLALATETPPAPDEVNPEVPQPLSALIMNLLAKDRSARPASAAMVAAALEATQETSTSPLPLAKPGALPAAPPKERNPWADLTEEAERPAPASPPRRRWRVATAAALLLVLAGALAAGIVVIIKNKDGKEVARVTVPEGGSAEIKQDGDSGKRKGDPANSNPDRRAAEWVLSIGGAIKIRQDGQERDIQTAKGVPGASFEVVLVNLTANRKVDDAGLEHLKGLNKLTELVLDGTQVSDAGLVRLKGLTELTELYLNRTRVSDAGLEHLKGLTKLTHLHLSGTQVSDAGLDRVKALTNLKDLALGGTQVSNAGLKHLKGLTNLTNLTLWTTRVSDTGLEDLKGLTNLTRLDLSNTQVSDAGLDHLKGLTNLSGLYLDGTQVSDAGLDHLKGLTNLTGLVLGGTQVSDAGLDHLKGLTNLTGLVLGGTQVSDAGLDHLKGLTNLTNLSLAGTQVSDAGLEHLKRLTNLTNLDLGGTQVSDAGLDHLKGLTNLTGLVLGGTRVRDAGLDHLKGLTKLAVLSLWNTRVSDAGLKHLAGLSNLTQLDLTGTQVTADGVAALQKALPKCKIISGPGGK